MLAVVGDLALEEAGTGERCDEGIDRAVALTHHHLFLAVDDELRFHRRRAGLEGVARRPMPDDLDLRTHRLDIGTHEPSVDLVRGDLGAGVLGDGLDLLGEVDLELTRKVEAVLVQQHIGHTALAGLAVDPDHGLVAAAEVTGIDRQIRHVPRVVLALERLAGLHIVDVGHALLDGVLVRTGEGGEDEIADVGCRSGRVMRLENSYTRGLPRCRRNRVRDRRPG